MIINGNKHNKSKNIGPKRPSGVYEKYRELARDIVRNEKTLSKLENTRNETIMQSSLQENLETISQANVLICQRLPIRREWRCRFNIWFIDSF